MELWMCWLSIVWQLRTACTRTRTFLWLVVCLAGMTIRSDLLGVTSIVRAIGLKAQCYDRILDFFHSSAVDISTLTSLWGKMVISIFPTILKVNGRILVVGDGIKIPKEGKKMPGVKSLHQESESNTKAPYIMGHSCQSVAVLVGALKSVFAVPLTSRIHEGTVFSNRDNKTLLDKMILLLDSLSLPEYYFIADAYYASRKIVKALLCRGNHLITRVRNNAVAYSLPKNKPRKIGRPNTYGNKIKLSSLFDNPQHMDVDISPVYGEKGVIIKYHCRDLLLRPLGIVVRFVAVIHPLRGSAIYMSTDFTLTPMQILSLYGKRFKIEVSFKQALHTIGTYTYHFWMRNMKPIRKGSGNQYHHKNSQQYRNAVKRKLDAYHRYIQVGIIAHGIIQHISVNSSNLVWKYFGSWLRTIRPGIPPSEFTTAIALKNSFFDFLAVNESYPILTKFLSEKLDFYTYKVLQKMA
jgi:hypothetical protein